jgi:hypothetical protein
MNNAHLAALIVLATGAVACSSDDSTSADADGGTKVTTPDTGTAVDYPTGPYGVDVGDILPNFALTGFVNESATGASTDGTFEDYSLAQLKATGAKYAFIHVSAADSDLSQAAAKLLGEKGGAMVAAGAQIVEVLAGKPGTPVKRADLESWISDNALTVTTVTDSEASPLTVLDAAAGQPESGFIIEMPKMVITWTAKGTTEYSTVEDGLHWLDSLLSE